MKRLFFLPISTLFFLLCAFSVSAQNSSIDELNNLLAKRDFFTLRTRLSKYDPTITPQDSLYFQASVQNTFGNNELSIDAIKKLSDQYATKLDDGAWINLLNILADDYAKIYDYKSTAASYAILMRRYGLQLDKSERSSYENNYVLYKALENVPAQTVRLVDNQPVQMSKDQQELWNIPLYVNNADSSSHFIFDSGAGFSTISSSAAKKLGIDILQSNIRVNSANDRQIIAQLGVAKELKIGGCIFNQVVFLVMDDAMLHFPTINYDIEGIIGFPVIRALQHITITQEGKLYIVPANKKSNQANFYYQGNAVRMQGIIGNDTLLFHLDTGAKQSELNKEYYDANKSYVRSISEKKKYKLGGAGGVTAYKAYQLPNCNIKIGKGNKTLSYIPVYPEKISPYGNAIGQDYIQLYSKMSIDFENCYIDFE